VQLKNHIQSVYQLPIFCHILSEYLAELTTRRLHAASAHMTGRELVRPRIVRSPIHRPERNAETMPLFERRKHEERFRPREGTRSQFAERRSFVDDRVAVQTRRRRRRMLTTGNTSSAAQFATESTANQRHAAGTCRARVTRTVAT